MIEFTKGLKYPWGAPKRLWNILWVLIPILGVFAIFGYARKIILKIVGGDTKGIPEFGDFFENTKNGFFLFLKMIPLMLVFQILTIILMLIPIVGWILLLAIELFILPWLSMNLIVKFTVASSFEVQKAAKVTFGNMGSYLIAILKTFGYVIVYGILCLVLVGIPCLYFGQNIFLADFYAKHKA